MQKLIFSPHMLDLGRPWFAELLNICRTFELLKESQLSCSRIASARGGCLCLTKQENGKMSPPVA